MSKKLKRRKLQKRLKNIFIFDREIEGSFLWVRMFLGGKQNG